MPKTNHWFILLSHHWQCCCHRHKMDEQDRQWEALCGITKVKWILQFPNTVIHEKHVKHEKILEKGVLKGWLIGKKPQKIFLLEIWKVWYNTTDQFMYMSQFWSWYQKCWSPKVCKAKKTWRKDAQYGKNQANCSLFLLMSILGWQVCMWLCQNKLQQMWDKVQV